LEYKVQEDHKEHRVR
jgi:hypothetical protein